MEPNLGRPPNLRSTTPLSQMVTIHTWTSCFSIASSSRYCNGVAHTARASISGSKYDPPVLLCSGLPTATERPLFFRNFWCHLHALALSNDSASQQHTLCNNGVTLIGSRWTAFITACTHGVVFLRDGVWANCIVSPAPRYLQ
jgi:hypothetical protein